MEQLGIVADRAELDAGKVSNNQLFWEVFQVALASQDELHDNLQMIRSSVTSNTIASKVPYDWKKLCAIWKYLNAE